MGARDCSFGITGTVPFGQTGWGEQNFHFYLMSRLGIPVAVLLLVHIPSWHGALLKGKINYICDFLNCLSYRLFKLPT